MNDATEGQAIAEEGYMKKRLPLPPTVLFHIRRVLQSAVTEKKMLGGLSFMLNGNMCCGVLGDDLMVRVWPDQYD